jgi:hypothetical protein
MGMWISENRDILFSFVAHDERKGITYYSGRHTVAEWIIYETKLNQSLERYRVRAGQVHLRHDMKNNKKKRKSREDIPLILSTYAPTEVGPTGYIKIMQEALDFPINLDGELKDSEYKNLNDWKRKKGFLIEDEFEDQLEKYEEKVGTNDLTIQPKDKEEIIRLEAQIKEKQLLLSEVQLGYNKSLERKLNISRMDWVLGQPQRKLKNQIENLMEQIKNIKYSS